MTEAIKEFGVGAAAAGLSIEESAAAIETLAEKGLKGSRAGNQLRNIFVKLQSGADATNPKVVGLAQALDNLADENLGAAELTKRFGLENAQAAQILIENKTRLNELKEAITGTNVAYEQAAIQTDNLEGDIEKLGNAWDGFLLQLNSGEGVIGNTARAITQFANDVVDALTDLSKSTEQLFRDEITRQSDEFAKEVLAGVRKEAAETTKTIDEQTDVLEEYSIFAREAAESLELQVQQETEAIKSAKELGKSEEVIQALTRKRNATLVRLRANLKIRSELEAEITELLKAQAEAEKSLNGETEKRARTIGDIEADLKAAKEATSGLAVGSDELRQNLFRIFQLTEELTAAQGKQTQAEKSAAKDREFNAKEREKFIDEFIQQINESEEAQKAFNDEVERLLNANFDELFEDAIAAEEAAAELSDELFIKRLEQIEAEREARREAAQELKDQAFETSNVLVEAQIAETEGAIAAQERRVEEAKRIAERGNAEQLQLEEERLAELNEKKARFVRTQRTSTCNR